MRFYNSDGSIGEMCGNGARCIARFAWENHIAGEHMTIETPAGIVHAWKIDKRTFKIRLNNPEVIKLDSPVAIQGVKYDCTYIELGNPGLPHAVVFLKYFERWDEKELFNLGKKIRNYEGFHKGANVNFCYVTGENEVKIKTFERGVEDFTLACGTGAGSTALAFVLRGLADGDKTIRLYAPGGILQVCIEFEGEETREDSGKTVKNLYLIGDTNIVATGEITDEDLSF